MGEKKLDVVFAEKLKGLHRKKSTIECYLGHYRAYMVWIARKRNGFVHPKDLGEADLEAWLNHLANECHVAPSTQNQAFYAILALYRHVIKRELVGVSALRAKKNETIRTPLEREQIPLVLNQLRGVGLVAAKLMYATGMRISEVARLRNKDIQFSAGQIFVYHGKGGKDRVVQCPEVIHADLRRQMESSRVVWQYDRHNGLNGVSLPYAYHRKHASARHELAWYYLFPADEESISPETGEMLRHHLSDDAIRKTFSRAVQRAGITQRCSPHCLRHSFATHMLENGVPIQTVMRLMGHADIRTTEQYLHLCRNGVTSASSPIEFLSTIEPSKREPLSRGSAALERALESPQVNQKPMLRVYAG